MHLKAGGVVSISIEAELEAYENVRPYMAICSHASLRGILEPYFVCPQSSMVPLGAPYLAQEMKLRSPNPVLLRRDLSTWLRTILDPWCSSYWSAFPSNTNATSIGHHRCHCLSPHSLVSQRIPYIIVFIACVHKLIDVSLPRRNGLTTGV